MPRRAIKEFTVTEGSIENAWYKITVRFRGKIVDEFVKPTMKEAQADFERAGYEISEEKSEMRRYE